MLNRCSIRFTVHPVLPRSAPMTIHRLGLRTLRGLFTLSLLAIPLAHAGNLAQLPPCNASGACENALKPKPDMLASGIQGQTNAPQNASEQTQPSNSQSDHGVASQSAEQATENGDAASDDAANQDGQRLAQLDQTVLDIDRALSQVGGSVKGLQQRTDRIIPESVEYNPVFDYQLPSNVRDSRMAQLNPQSKPRSHWSQRLSVPEPTTLALLSMGLLVIYFLHRRNKSH